MKSGYEGVTFKRLYLFGFFSFPIHASLTIKSTLHIIVMKYIERKGEIWTKATFDMANPAIQISLANPPVQQTSAVAAVAAIFLVIAVIPVL